MKKIILPLALMVSSTYAMDLRYGQGDFEWGVSLFGVSPSVTIDDKIYSINEQHKNIDDTSWYYFGNLDIHNSDQLDTVTDIADDISGILPVKIAAFPTSYKVSGLDADLGVGYDVYQDTNSYFGIGLMTGISTPYIEMKNLVDTIGSIGKVLKDTSTDVKTYKLGLTLQGSYGFTDSFSIYGTAAISIQTGTIKNKSISSELDVNGLYTALDVGAKYSLSGGTSDLYIKVGYVYKKWNIDDISGSFAGSIPINILAFSEIDMSVKYPYIGIGYNF